MSLSDRIERERQEIEARVAAEAAARDQRYAQGRDMIAQLNGRLQAIVAGVSSDTLRWQGDKLTDNTSISISDYRPRQARRGSGRKPRVPEIKLRASPDPERGAWHVAAEVSDAWVLNLDVPDDPARRYAARAVFTDVSDAVEWFEQRLARGIAAMQLWSAANPADTARPAEPGGEDTAAPSEKINRAAPRPKARTEEVAPTVTWTLDDDKNSLVQMVKRIPLVIWVFLGFLFWILIQAPNR
ncbi:MAG: hypothetical protein AB7I36_07430 [Rhodospirillaceae bacterium]